MSETDHAVALARLQARYADIVTRRAWSELADIFRPDVTIEVDVVSSPARTFVGPDDFAAFVDGAMARFDHFSFVILNAVVELDPTFERADGRMFISEVRHERNTDEWSTTYGVYVDEHVYVDGSWWFASRRYRSMARTGPDAGVFGLPS